jgi:hypothetical protein
MPDCGTPDASDSSSCVHGRGLRPQNASCNLVAMCIVATPVTRPFVITRRASNIIVTPDTSKRLYECRLLAIDDSASYR